MSNDINSKMKDKKWGRIMLEVGVIFGRKTHPESINFVRIQQDDREGKLHFINEMYINKKAVPNLIKKLNECLT